MALKKPLFFVLAVLVSCWLAAHRWGDSSHAIGLMSANGGKNRHPAVMKGGKQHYSQITTVTVLPPFQGDARIALEGAPQVDYEIRLAGPVIDLGFRRTPELRGNMLYNVRAGDRLALWTLIRPGDRNSADKPESGAAGRSGTCRGVFSRLKNILNGSIGLHQTDSKRSTIYGNYSLAFYDAATDKPVLNIPLVFTAPGDENGRHHDE